MANHLQEALGELQGFDFGYDGDIDVPENAYSALVDSWWARQQQQPPPVYMAAENILNRAAGLLGICAANDDVYRRLGGAADADAPFWSFVAATWNPLFPL